MRTDPSRAPGMPALALSAFRRSELSLRGIGSKSSHGPGVQQEQGSALAPALSLDQLLEWLPGRDPGVAQQALWDLLSRHEGGAGPPLERAALLSLDAIARETCERLLDRYVEGDAQQRLFGRRTLASALRLSQSLIRAWSRVLESPGAPEAEDAATALVRLLFFRRVEIVLRMFRYKRRNADHWRALHDGYRFARARDGHLREVRVPLRDGLEMATSVEREYIQALLLDAVNSGQLSPRETLAARACFARWSRELRLRHDGSAFSVDLRTAEALVRRNSGVHDLVLYLDTAPVITSIEEEIAQLRDTASRGDEATQAAGHARTALLHKLAALLSPTSTHVARRGERTPEASAVQVLAGLPQLVDALRRAAMRQQEAASPLEESTIGAFGGQTREGSRLGTHAVDPGSFHEPESWQIRDRSASGCRLRGKTADLNRVIPGSLIAIRTGDTAPWSLAVVRRLRRLMVDHVEIGVEHVGHNPRYVKVVMDEASDPMTPSRGASEPRCIGALYFPASEELPEAPIRTLLIPSREFRRGRQVTLLSSNAMYAMRLNEPIRRESEFVWSSFTITGKVDADGDPPRRRSDEE